MARVFTGPGTTLVATSEDAPPSWRASIEAQGAEIVAFPKHDGRVDLVALLQHLGQRDIISLLVEGGGVFLGAFFDRGLVDKLHAVIAPLVIGAADAPTPVAGHGAERMVDALRLRDITVERLGDDILVTGYPKFARPTE
jgi:diaminohydroxyphosphoribosylaminopyrimidine deaminase/5-amino-6-(5-phosphoribosylamino)uracil reductase